jgi:nicotinamidase-related amidase
MHKAAFTPKNAAMLLIDHQIGTMAWTHSHDINRVKQNALKLAKIAKAVGLPTVLTSSMEDRVQGPLVAELEQILPDEFSARIKRPGRGKARFSLPAATDDRQSRCAGPRS